MNSQDFDDYLTGLNTGTSFNGMSWLGTQHRYEPPPVQNLAPPIAAPARHEQPIASMPYPTPPPPGPAPAARAAPPSFRQKWIWELSDTLVSAFDRVIDPFLHSRTYQILWTSSAFAGGLCAYVIGAPGELPAHWSVPWLFAALCALLAACVPGLVLLSTRGLLWAAGALVQLGAALTAVAAFVGLVGGGGYVVLAILEAMN